MVAIKLKGEHAMQRFVVLNRHAEDTRSANCGDGAHAEGAIRRVVEQRFDSRAKCEALFARSLFYRVEHLLGDAEMPGRLARVRAHAAKYPLQADAFGELLRRHFL